MRQVLKTNKSMLIYIFAVLVVLSTFLGGFLALRLKSKLEFLMAFSAGFLVSLVFFELLPEIKDLSSDLAVDFSNLMIAAGLSFLAFHLFEKFAVIHACHGDHCASEQHKRIGPLGALGISLHSVLDGLTVGTSFIISANLGIAVGLAVVFHKITDGLNTAILLLRSKYGQKSVILWLALNSIITIAGIYLAYFISVPRTLLAYFLATFAGFFLYIGASDLLPEAHKEKVSPILVLATVAGFAVFFLLSKSIGL